MLYERSPQESEDMPVLWTGMDDFKPQGYQPNIHGHDPLLKKELDMINASIFVGNPAMMPSH